MVSVLASSAVDHVFEPRSARTNDYEIGICGFTAKLAVLRRKSKGYFSVKHVELRSKQVGPESG